MADRTFRVMIRKTVQVKQFEPTVVELAVEGTCDEADLKQERDKNYEELKTKMNDIFNPKPKKDCLS